MTGFNKVVDSYEAAMDGIEDGMMLIVGGFGLCGIPQDLIQELVRKQSKGLTVVSNNCGVDDWGLGLLLHGRQIAKAISSYVGENKLFEKQFLDGDLELELTPQGTLAEKIRAGGAGIPAFYTAAGYGTSVAEGKDVRDFNGRPHILEESIVGDFALVHAKVADRYGNCIYNATAQNFNPMAATAGKVTVVEAEEIVEPGDLDPAQIHTAGIYVQRVVQASAEKRIEFRTVREEG